MTLAVLVTDISEQAVKGFCYLNHRTGGYFARRLADRILRKDSNINLWALVNFSFPIYGHSWADSHLG